MFENERMEQRNKWDPSFPQEREDYKIMEDIGKLLECNKCDGKLGKKYIKMDKRSGHKVNWLMEASDIEIDSKFLRKMIWGINYMLSHKEKGNLKITLKRISFPNKLIITLFESICFYLIVYKNIIVTINLEIPRNMISEYLQFSPLMVDCSEKLIGHFQGDVTFRHYRKIVLSENYQNEHLSEISTSIKDFLKNNDIDKKTANYLSEVIGEIVGNALDHGKSDCLIDIDITEPDYVKASNPDSDNRFYGLNVVVLNFSDISFFEKLKNKMNVPLNLDDESKVRYDKVREAKEYHSQFFNNNYTEDDFYTVASFQHEISGEIEKQGNGGGGLTELLEAVINKSDEECCYMLSKKRVVNFKREFLRYNDDDFIGFNKEQNFITGLPDDSVLSDFGIFLPGVAYNLNFAIQMEDDENATREE